MTYLVVYRKSKKDLLKSKKIEPVVVLWYDFDALL